MYIAYLDEFGHIGPFVNRDAEKYNESPVFGLAGIILPICEVRGFGTWFFQRKQDLFRSEIDQSGSHPAIWEKKGSRLYTLENVRQHRYIRDFTNRFFSKIKNSGGHAFYVGIEKKSAVETHQPNELYGSILREAIKRIDQFCEHDCYDGGGFFLVLDEHPRRESLITTASQAMYRVDDPRRSLIELPFQVESHRYQTIQAADWVAALVGRIAATWTKPEQYMDWQPFRTYFEARLKKAQIRSGVRNT